LISILNGKKHKNTAESSLFDITANCGIILAKLTSNKKLKGFLIVSIDLHKQAIERSENLKYSRKVTSETA